MRKNSRNSDYLGCVGYNESHDDLGEATGFWWFEDEAQLWQTYQRSELLNVAFSNLGAPTFSEIIWMTDPDGFIVLQLLVISTQRIHGRQYDLLEITVEWLKRQGHILNADEVAIAGFAREMLS
jgi:hypothetical protein